MWAYFFIGPEYLVMAAIAFVISAWASFKCKRTFRKYNKIGILSGLTGAQAARLILNQYGLERIQVECVTGELTDHYDPRAKVLRLSEAVFFSPSISAVGVAAHEAGHAIQHARHYVPVLFRSAIVPVTNIGSRLAMPTVLVGVLLGREEFVSLGIVLFGLMMLFQLVTLPVELNASRRAMQILADCGYVQPGKEMKGVKKVLSAAALTYVAALLAALVSFVRFVALASSLSKRR